MEMKERDVDYDDEDDFEISHTQERSSLEYARPQAALGPNGHCKIRDPFLDEGFAFSESLVDADVFGIGYMPRKTYF